MTNSTQTPPREHVAICYNVSTIKVDYAITSRLHAYRWINIAINYLYQHFRLRRLKSNCRANGIVGFVRQTLHDKNTAKCLWKITREPSDCTTWRRTSCGKFNVSRIVNLEREFSEEWKELDGVWWGSAREVCSRVSLALLVHLRYWMRLGVYRFFYNLWT